MFPHFHNPVPVIPMQYNKFKYVKRSLKEGIVKHLSPKERKLQNIINYVK